MADDGARVALVGRTKDVLERATQDLTDRGSPDALGLVADTGDAEAVQRVFDEIGERWNGELNALINAVGPGTQGTFEDLTDDQWREAFDDGVMGMVHCVRSALPLLRKAQWARIVNFSAHSTQRQTVILPAYTAAKAALTSISKNLSLLLAPDEIMVNVVSPGSIASEALVGWAGSVGVDGRGPLCADGRHRQALRASGAHAPRGSARGDRPRRRVSRITAQLVHDRRQHQRRRRK
jgi:3-oxoacyl-[acyl-carrier protein] reductase